MQLPLKSLTFTTLPKSRSTIAAPQFVDRLKEDWNETVIT
jgi:hypothetical protein